MQEQFSVKFTTNKDMFYPFQIETVSDAFTSVQLKRVNREIQKEKRRIREHKRREQAERTSFVRQEVAPTNIDLRKD